MEKITTEISKVDGIVYYEILVDGKKHQGSYTFENWLHEIMKLKDELQFNLFGGKKNNLFGGKKKKNGNTKRNI